MSLGHEHTLRLEEVTLWQGRKEGGAHRRAILDKKQRRLRLLTQTGTPEGVPAAWSHIPR